MSIRRRIDVETTSCVYIYSNVPLYQNFSQFEEIQIMGPNLPKIHELEKFWKC